MQTLIRLSLDHPRQVLALALLATIVLGAGIPRLEIRTDGDALLPTNDRVIEQDARDRKIFRDPRTLLLLVESRSEEASLATPVGLRALRDLHSKLLREDVLQPTGLVSLAGLDRVVDRPGGGIAIESFLERVPDEPLRFARLLSDIREHPLSDGLLLSEDGRLALFSLPVNEAVDVRTATTTMERFCRETRVDANDSFALVLAGPLVAETTLGDKVLRDLAVLVPLMVLVIVVLLFAMLRSLGGVMIPMIETVTVLIWTFGAMGWLGAPIALVTTVLPVVLMAMCITDEIHLLERLNAHAPLPSMRARIESALSDVGPPIILTSLTTALGFLSFWSASIAPMQQFGVFAAFGILVAMFLSFSLIPAILLLLPEAWLRPRTRSVGADTLVRFGRLAAAHPGRGFAVALIVLLLLAPGWARLRVGDSWVDNFDPASPLVRAEQAINESFWGSYRFDLVVEAGPGFFMDPLGVALAEQVRDVIADAPFSAGAETYLTPLEILADFLDPDGPRRLSERAPEQLWDLFTMAEMSENRVALGRLIASEGGIARFRIYMPSADYERALALGGVLGPAMARLVEDVGARFHFSGDVPVATALVESIVLNQLRSIGWAVVTIALLLLVFARRASALLAIVPVAIASAGLFGAMGWLDIELGIATSMFASLSVGVGVDFGIHFLHRFQREREAGLEPPAAIQETIEKAGQALFWNAVVLGIGFAVLSASSLKPNHQLGGLLCGSTFACFASCFLLLPYLLTRRLRSRTAPMLAGAIVLAALATPSAIRAETFDCDAAPDERATKLMQEVESIHRSTFRIHRLHIETLYPEGSRLATQLTSEPAPKTLWGVVEGDSRDTWIIFVFTGPGRMAGTTLLIHDPAGAENEDSIWFYLRAFEHFHKIEGAVERSVVPGTALTYEDARGYIAVDRYRFHDLEGGAEGTRRILACPRSREVAEHLGYGAVVVDVDPARHLVLAVQYYRLGGGALKRYGLRDSVELAGRHFPTHARLEHSAGGFDNEISYEYWIPEAGDTTALFKPEMKSATFLERMQDYLVANGLRDRIDAELAEAERRTRIYDERIEAWNQESRERRARQRREREERRKAPAREKTDPGEVDESPIGTPPPRP